MADYLTLAEVLTIHHTLIEHFGGSHGLRDPGALEAALFRPQTGYYDDILQEAAALWESLTINHPFIDDNKRVAFAVVDIFLRINGYRITAKSEEIWTFINNLFQENAFQFDKLEPWLRKYTKKIR